ncbi:hypothetical protein ACOTFF_05680 [Achromobacter xylosoxidans]
MASLAWADVPPDIDQPRVVVELRQALLFSVIALFPWVTFVIGRAGPAVVAG